VKEDEVDRDKRRQSAEKQKSAKDSKKRGKKKKNLDRQALEARRSKSRKRGNLKNNPPVRMKAGTVMMIATTTRGWHLASTGSSRVRLEAVSTPPEQGHKRWGQADLTALVLTPLPCLCQVRTSRPTDLPLRQRRVVGLSPRRRGLQQGRCWPQER